MYTYYFDNKINVETVNNLINNLEEKENIVLWFSTVGGEIPAMKVLISYLNLRSKDIKLIITDSLASAGTLLLTNFKGEIEFKGLDYILFHLYDRMRYPLRKGHDSFDDILQEQDTEGNLKLAAKFKKLGLNKKEIKQFLKGEDVILYKKDFNKLNINI